MKSFVEAKNIKTMRQIICNDKHSKLNATEVLDVRRPSSESEVISIIHEAKTKGEALSICGARHAMGGQQFGKNTILMDMGELSEVGIVDLENGLVEIGAGVVWSALIESLHLQQKGESEVWSIRQKQTGADDLTLGGSLAANVHGRGLNMRPIIDDVEAFTLITADGISVRCSRTENNKLFSLAIGGYGCFGVITSIKLRLAKRRTLQRLVKITTIDHVIPELEQRMDEGCLFGDFQFAIDEQSEDFLKLGVLSSYRPVDVEYQEDEEPGDLDADDWKRLTWLAHHDRAAAFEVYSKFYLGTHGKLYASDTHQLTVYLEDYHQELDQQTCAEVPGSEVIGELYVPPKELVSFISEAGASLKAAGVTVIYGTVRMIRQDEESFLAWAKEDYACVIFNLHTDHDEAGIEKTANAFRELTDIALDKGGSFYLTYHRWARRDQIRQAYPQFEEFLRQKSSHDPSSRFQSDWWRYYQSEFSS